MRWFKGGRIKRVLIVDDDGPVRVALEQLLGRGPGSWGYDTIAVESAEEARQLLATERFDCAIVDHRLRGEERGERLAKEIAVLYPKCGVVVWTGFADLETTRSLIPFGIPVIDKGDFETLRLEVRRRVMNEFVDLVREWGTLSALATIAITIITGVFRLGGFKVQLNHLILSVDEMKGQLAGILGRVNNHAERLSRMEGEMSADRERARRDRERRG